MSGCNNFDLPIRIINGVNDSIFADPYSPAVDGSYKLSATGGSRICSK
jgi:hypothetical protein